MGQESREGYGYTSINTTASEYLETDPIPPIDPAQLKIHPHKKSKLLTAILGTVPSSVLGLILVPGDKLTPYKLTQDIIKHINQSTKDDHKYLKTEAESIRFTGDMSFDDYIRQHTAVRQKMIAARYPAITDEETTIDFILFGLQKTANLTPIIGNLIINKPNSIKDFVRKYKVLYDVYQLPHGLTPTPPPIQTEQYIANSTTNPPTQQPITHQYANSYQYRRPYRGQYR